MFLETLFVELMSDVVEFLKESSILVAKKRKKISVVYEELRNFLPCYFDMLPIDIKTLIIKKILKYEENSIYKSSKRWLKKYKLFTSIDPHPPIKVARFAGKSCRNGRFAE